ncbi:5' nucleotidase, NT5C type [Chitinophaga solisilvae]|uniref:5'(3')-deoxyribonucleotidase n=1 Tax=Chitinophaga solisilvae TaxID=1233460 RepID=A0A3S1AX66_9BACT|nr:5'(3')-deoxyribonucleotidase [Chitinophaga solisilvae]NSL89628.1 5'(3')-deoxyribonucleotidase [Chitinophaga solisilvae]
MARIAIDMDGVMADTTSHYLKYYEEEYGIRVDPATLAGAAEGEGFDDKEACRRYITSPGFFRTLPVMPGSQEVVKALYDKYEVFIVSAAMEFPLSLKEKLEWLNEHFPFISWQRVVFCGSKTIVDADIMIDDHDKNLRYFDGRKLIFSAPHNLHINDYQRVNSWEEVAAALLQEQLVKG